jgi:hypothetical protein
MNWWPSGYIPIIYYAEAAGGVGEQNAILTEASDDILTETSSLLLTENG